MPGKRWVFTTRVEPISPPQIPLAAFLMTERLQPRSLNQAADGPKGRKKYGGAGYRPRVHNVYSTHRLSP